VTEPIHVVDWRPTLLEICNAKATGDLPMDGRDAWQTISTGAKSPHDVILLNTAPAVGAVRAGDWKIVVHHQDGGQRAQKPNAKAKREAKSTDDQVELYNLRDDPYEKSNIAEAQPQKVDELTKRLKAFAEAAAPPKAKPQPKDYVAPKVWGEFGG
jgi:arylsulfatase A-like enzyme